MQVIYNLIDGEDKIQIVGCGSIIPSLSNCNMSFDRSSGHAGAASVRGVHRQVGGHPAGGCQGSPARAGRRQDTHSARRVKVGFSANMG